MLRLRAEGLHGSGVRALRAPALALASLLVCLAAIALLPADRAGTLSVILGVAAVAAGLSAVHRPAGGVSLSASFIVTLLAAAFLGPASAAATAAIAELSATARQRTRWQ